MARRDFCAGQIGYRGSLTGSSNEGVYSVEAQSATDDG